MDLEQKYEVGIQLLMFFRYHKQNASAVKPKEKSNILLKRYHGNTESN